MASVRKLKYRSGSSAWQVVWAVYDNSGKRIRQDTKAFSTQKQAKAHKAHVETTIERKRIADPDQHTVRSYLNYWLDRLAQDGDGTVPRGRPMKTLEDTTLSGYRRHCEMACRYIGDIPLRRLGPDDLDRAYDRLLSEGGSTQKRDAEGRRQSRPLAPRTVHHIHTVLKNALGRGVRWRFLAENPCDLAEPPRLKQSYVTPSGNRKRKKRSLTDQELFAILDAAEAFDAYPAMDILIRTLMETGMRRSEILGLAFDAVDLAAGTIHIRRRVTLVGKLPTLQAGTKTATSDRRLPISRDLVAMLSEYETRIKERALAFGPGYQREPLLVFADIDGQPMVPDTLSSRVRILLNRCGITDVPAGSHVLRHSMGSKLIRKADLITVQRRMGHSLPSTTANIYLHGDEAADRAGAEMLGDIFKARPKK